MSPVFTWEGEGEVPNFCPNACGGLTENPYGGPCQKCWDAVGRSDAGELAGEDECDGADR